MVQAVDAELGLAGDVGESGIGFEPDLFGGQQPGAVVGQTANMADVIVQGAAEDGVDQLRPAAYANHGDAVFQRVPNPFDFQCVSFWIELDPGIDFTAVMLRADIVTATDHQCIRRRGADGELVSFVSEYEQKPLKGPTALMLDSRGSMYFCDSGPLGETTLASPRGSVFFISHDGQLLQPLALESLAHPSGLALAPDESTLYVTEMPANRVLRFVQRPAGVYHCSVFHQFSGGLGPSAIAVDKSGNLYVARYDFAAPDRKGVVSVISAAGKLVQDIEAPAAELTGITFDRSQGTVFVSEASTGSVYSFAP